jgi:hypothetical protein
MPEKYHGKPCKNCQGTHKYSNGTCINCHAKYYKKYYSDRHEKPVRLWGKSGRNGSLEHILYSSRQRAHRGGYLPVDVATIPANWRELREGKCANHAVCGYEHRPGLNNRLSMDHCHTTGAYRAMLCYPCNQDIEILANAHTEKYRTLWDIINATKEKDPTPIEGCRVSRPRVRRVSQAVKPSM